MRLGKMRPNLDSNINHRAVAQAVVEVLGKYKIPFTKNVVDALIGDGASFITKAYKDILQPLIPELMHIWCLSHQLNLVGEKWQDHANNTLVKKYLSLMNSLFSHSTSRKLRFKAVCKRFGLSPALLPQYNVTRWNSWHDCAVANCENWRQLKHLYQRNANTMLLICLTTCVT